MSLSSSTEVAIEYCLFDGLTDGETSEGEIEDICVWSGSLLHLSLSEAVMKETTISNFSKGGLSVSSGTLEIVKGEFEENNPHSPEYPSFRRNIICSGEESTLTISSLKSGDGIQANSSLWILASSDCVMKGVTEERNSSFFIPTLSNETKMTIEIVWEIAFVGTCLIPCNLSYSLIFNTTPETRRNFEFRPDHPDTSANQTVGSTELSEYDTSAAVILTLRYMGHNGSWVESNGIVLKNEEDGNPSQSGIPPEATSYFISLIVFVVLFIAAVIVILVVVVYFWRKKKNEEERIHDAGKGEEGREEKKKGMAVESVYEKSPSEMEVHGGIPAPSSTDGGEVREGGRENAGPN
jgi:hypothetical protein